MKSGLNIVIPSNSAELAVAIHKKLTSIFPEKSDKFVVYTQHVGV